MKQEIAKILQQVSLFFLLFFSTISVTTAQYTLTDADVVVTGGVIQSCSYDFAIKDVIIPATLDGQSVTGISNAVFYYKGLTSIELPASLTYIGDNAFSYNSLTEINLPNGLIHIGESAFNNNQITTVNGTASDGIFYARNADATIDYTTIVSYGGGADGVIIPSQVVIIGAFAFISNTLTSVDFSACTALTTIGEGAFMSSFFSGISLTSIDLSACTSLTTIESKAFWENSINSLNLNGCTALTTIGAYAFRGNNLASLDLSTCTALTNVDFEAFHENSLTEIKLPNSITSLGESVFNGNQITIFNGMSHNGIFYARKSDATIDSTIIVSYGGASKEVIVPAQVVTIATQAFAYNSLTSVDFSTCTALIDIGTRAFQSNSFTSVDLSACTSLTSIQSWAFAYNALASLDLSGCTALTTIGSYAFYNNLLTEFMLPTPDIPDYQFNYWIGGGNIYAGGETVSNLSITYGANLTSTFKVVTFTVTDGVYPIEGANVQLGSNGTVTTNADGIAVFAKVFPANNIAYTVSALNYDNASGTVSVIDSDISKEVTLNLTTYNVTFTINSGTDAIAGATVSLNGYGTVTSDASGIATFSNVLPANNIIYTVSASNYDGTSGTVSVLNSNVNEEVTLSLVYNVTFTINSGTDAIAGATVSLNGYGTATSDASGIATFTNVALANDIAYTVSASNYDDVSGTVSVADSDVSEEITLSLTTYNVTFTINSGTEAVAGATVSLNGYGTATSDASGIATFTNVVPVNSIAYTVSAPNYDDVSGAVSVGNSDVSEEVTLSLTTYNVTFTINSGTEAVAGATVSLSGYGTATSDASGIAVFTDVAPETDIAYTVAAGNNGDANGSISVVDSNVSEDVNLTTTGFNDLINSELRVFPNPATDLVSVTQATEDKITNIELYTLGGQKVYLKSFNKNQNRIDLNVKELKEGVYVLRLLTQSNQIFSKRVLKK